MPVKTAFISGGMYDPLYASLDAFHRQTGITVEVAFSGDHPTLNHHLAALPDVPYDLVSTHSKYAPSQLGFLAPLDPLLSGGDLRDFLPAVLELVRVDGQLFALPRKVDVRLLHYRTDLIDLLSPAALPAHPISTDSSFRGANRACSAHSTSWSKPLADAFFRPISCRRSRTMPDAGRSLSCGRCSLKASPRLTFPAGTMTAFTPISAPATPP